MAESEYGPGLSDYRTRAPRFLPELWMKEAKINLSFFGFGVEIKGEPQIVDIEVALNKILHTIKKNNKRLLITIDEVSNTKDMRVFASSYQLFLREDLPVFLLMSGLYKNIDALRNADGMTFLERAPRTMLSSLKMDAIADNYSRIIGLPMDRSMRLAQASKGYSFAFQTIGYFVWENTDNIDKGLLEAREYLYEFSYNKIWSELSSKDKLFVYAMAVASSNEVIAIRRQLNYTSNQFNPYRDRMIKAGVVYSEHNGLLDFALPWFGEYAIMKHEHMENLE